MVDHVIQIHDALKEKKAREEEALVVVAMKENVAST